MKKIIYLFCLICTITLAKGQYYRPDHGFLPGINAGYFYPTGDMGKILKNGIGGNVSAKYLINKMIGIGFEAGYYGFKTKVNLNKDDVSQKYKYHLIPVLLEATFYVPTWNRTTLPYLGIQFGGVFLPARCRTPIYRLFCLPFFFKTPVSVFTGSGASWRSLVSTLGQGMDGPESEGRLCPPNRRCI